ncbi:hypothetical protein MTO96_030518 [Rhipicephalus appendiculatus]
MFSPRFESWVPGKEEKEIHGNLYYSFGTNHGPEYMGLICMPTSSEPLRARAPQGYRIQQVSFAQGRC